MSFSEIREITPPETNDFALWDSYLKYGGLPACVLEGDESKKRQYLSEIFNVTYLSDIEERRDLRNSSSLREVTSFLALSVGLLINPSKISNTFKSKTNGWPSPKTIRRYVSYLEGAFMVSFVRRYDLKGKEIIGGSGKYYFDDMGIRNAASGFKGFDQEPHFMENVSIYNPPCFWKTKRKSKKKKRL